jgi:hypothetical protein
LLTFFLNRLIGFDRNRFDHHRDGYYLRASVAKNLEKIALNEKQLGIVIGYITDGYLSLCVSIFFSNTFPLAIFQFLISFSPQ